MTATNAISQEALRAAAAKLPGGRLQDARDAAIDQLVARGSVWRYFVRQGRPHGGKPIVNGGNGLIPLSHAMFRRQYEKTIIHIIINHPHRGIGCHEKPSPRQGQGAPDIPKVRFAGPGDGGAMRVSVFDIRWDHRNCRLRSVKGPYLPVQKKRYCGACRNAKFARW